MLEIPDPIHRVMKSVASSNGETMKDFVLRAMEVLLRKEAKIDVRSARDGYITEKEADQILKGFLTKTASNIHGKKEVLISEKEFFKELKKYKA